MHKQQPQHKRPQQRPQQHHHHHPPHPRIMVQDYPGRVPKTGPHPNRFTILGISFGFLTVGLWSIVWGLPVAFPLPPTIIDPLGGPITTGVFFFTMGMIGLIVGLLPQRY